MRIQWPLTLRNGWNAESKVITTASRCQQFVGPVAVDAWIEFVGRFAAASRARCAAEQDDGRSGR